MVVSRAALHFWEEPPISGEAGSGTIFFANCNLRCCYCQNFAISRGDAGKAASVGDVAGMMLDLQNQGAMNVNLVTPTHYSDSVRSAVVLAREGGLDLPIVWNTSGYETAENVRANDGMVGVYLTDFKYFDDRISRAYSGVSDYMEVASRALEAMVECVGGFEYDDFGGVERMTRGVMVRHLLLPGCLDDSKAVLRLLRHRFGDSVKVSIMNQYTPVLASAAERGDAAAKLVLGKHPQLANAVPDADYEELLDYADAIGIEDYFWQDGETCKERFIPEFE